MFLDLDSPTSGFSELVAHWKSVSLPVGDC